MTSGIKKFIAFTYIILPVVFFFNVPFVEAAISYTGEGTFTLHIDNCDSFALYGATDSADFVGTNTFQGACGDLSGSPYEPTADSSSDLYIYEITEPESDCFDMTPDQSCLTSLETEIHFTSDGSTWSLFSEEESSEETIIDWGSATTTNYMLGSLNFGVTILIVFAFLGMCGYVWNKWDRKKPWH